MPGDLVVEPFRETDRDLRSGDPLGFVDLKPYPERVVQAERKTGYSDALIAVSGTLAWVATLPLSISI